MLTSWFKTILSYLYTLFLCGKVEAYMHKHNCNVLTALEEISKQEILIRKMTDKKFIYRYVTKEEADQALDRLRKYSKETT